MTSPVSPLIARALLDVVARRTSASWLELAADGGASALVEVAFDEATRRVGAGPLALTDDERAHLCELGLTWSLASWSVDDAARAVVLLQAGERLGDEDVEAVIQRRWGAGDGRQRSAILRTLPLLPRGERFVHLALQARRGAVRRVFEALACDNPFPATNFHEVHFTDMVLAALEADLPLARIVGLERRVTAELTGRARRFATARRAAGRSVPADLWRLGTERTAA